MKSLLILTVAISAAFAIAAAQAQAPARMVKGTVRNEAGVPVLGARVTLSCGNTSAAVSGNTAVDGTYVLGPLSGLVCQLQAAAQASAASETVDLSRPPASGTLVAADLILRAAAGASGPPPPSFQASQIRGLIDPGGYSAPATAAAASGLLADMASVRRNDLSAGRGSGAKPCSETGSQTSVAAGPLAHARMLIEQQQFGAAYALLTEPGGSIEDPERYALLAQADEGLGHFSAAADAYRMANLQRPTLAYVFGQGYELTLSARLEEAVKVFAEGLMLYPAATRLLIGKGTAEYLAGHSAAAVNTFLDAVRLTPGDAQAYPFLVQAYVASGEQPERVTAVVEGHLKRSPNDGEAYYLKALMLSRHDAATASDVDAAQIESLLRRALALDPALAAAHLRLGVLEARRGEDASAAQHFETALKLDPKLDEAHLRLANVYRKLGRKAESDEQIKLFQATRAASQTGDDQGISLSQFVSVMHRAPAESCPPLPSAVP